MILGLSIGLVLMGIGYLGIQHYAMGVDERPEPKPITPADLGRIEHDATVDYLAHVDSALRLVQGSNVIPMPSQREPGRWS